MFQQPPWEKNIPQHGDTHVKFQHSQKKKTPNIDLWPLYVHTHVYLCIHTYTTKQNLFLLITCHLKLWGPCKTLERTLAVWRESSVVRSTDFTFRESRVNSQHTHRGSRQFVTPVPGTLTPSADFWGHQAYARCRDVHASKHLYTRKWWDYFLKT